MWATPLAWFFATVALPMVPFLYLFVFTDVAKFAAQQTAPSRVLLSLAPAGILFAILAAADVLAAVPAESGSLRDVQHAE